jgi:hypothetical protein
MIEVKIPDRGPNQIMEIVRELRDQGLVQGIDFDFAYRHAGYDPVSGHFVEPRHTVFTFHVEKHATFFILKYGK